MKGSQSFEAPLEVIFFPIIPNPVQVNSSLIPYGKTWFVDGLV